MLTRPILSGLFAAGLGLAGLGVTATQPQALPHASLGQAWQDAASAETVQYRRGFGRGYGYGYGRRYGYGYGVGGLAALGLLGGAAIAGQGYYGPGYYAPGSYGDDCYYVRAIVRDQYGYRRRVRRLVCD